MNFIHLCISKALIVVPRTFGYDTSGSSTHKSADLIYLDSTLVFDVTSYFYGIRSAEAAVHTRRPRRAPKKLRGVLY